MGSIIKGDATIKVGSSKSSMTDAINTTLISTGQDPFVKLNNQRDFPLIISRI